MKTARFRTRNTVYEINDEGIHRNGVLEIEADRITSHQYHGGASDLATEPSVGARLYATYRDNKDTGKSMYIHTTAIAEVLPVPEVSIAS